ANCTPSGLMIFDNNNEYWFVNASAASEIGLADGAVVGKKPVEVMGGERGRKVEKNLDYVKLSGKPMEILHQENTDNGGVRYVHSSYYPISSFGDFPGGVMVRDENVTTIIVERERRETMLRQVITTLVAVVDRRDPYASGHSARLGHLARELAVEMNLPEREVDAAEIAGSLMNFGKVLVSRSILTKTEGLTPDELQRIRDSIMTSSDILSQIDFNMPVVPTLRQALERFDGTGVPDGIKGDEILMTARILAVANAFVALVSPRAYRPGIDFMIACQNLARDGGKAFDPRVIDALDRFLKKNAAKISWLAMTKPAA
ncbi:MAG: HD domain-containing phosphohydrolase, partial [Alphaproteobacteria bacterium]